MKRYTAVMQARGRIPEAAAIRSSMERQLLRHPVTFRLGQAATDTSGSIQVPLASDSGREDLKRALRGIESELPLSLTGIEWGWPAGAVGGVPTGAVTSEIEDPYAEPTARDPGDQEFGFGVRQSFSLAFSLGLPLAFSAYIVARLAWNFESAALEMALLLLFWVGVATTLTLPTRMLARIAATPEGLELRYRFPPRRRRVPWKDILGLGVMPGELRLLMPNRSRRVSIQGLREPARLIAAIKKRAALRFVEGHVGPALLYRRPNGQ